jgi:hypothetical protein
MSQRSLLLSILIGIACGACQPQVPPPLAPATTPLAPPVEVTSAPEAVRGISVFARGDGELEQFVRILERDLMKAGFLVVDTPAREHDLTISLVGDGHSESRATLNHASSVTMTYTVDATISAGGALLDSLKESGSAAVVQSGDFTAFNTEVTEQKRRTHENMAAKLVNSLSNSAKLAAFAAKRPKPAPAAK